MLNFKLLEDKIIISVKLHKLIFYDVNIEIAIVYHVNRE